MVLFVPWEHDQCISVESIWINSLREPPHIERRTVWRIHTRLQDIRRNCGGLVPICHPALGPDIELGNLHLYADISVSVHGLQHLRVGGSRFHNEMGFHSGTIDRNAFGPEGFDDLY